MSYEQSTVCKDGDVVQNDGGGNHVEERMGGETGESRHNHQGNEMRRELGGVGSG